MLVKIGYGLNYGWRVFATALGFALFGVGGLVISLIFFPLVCLIVSDKPKRQLHVQVIIHNCFYFYITLLKILGIMTTEVIGKEKLLDDSAQLLIANHPTLLDVVMILSILPRTNCIVKQALFENFFIRGVVSAAGYISNSSDPQKLILDCVDSLNQGHSLVIFPEGTRTTPKKKLRFQRAPARVAIEGKINITPITITCVPETLTKNRKWYQIPLRRFHLRLSVGENIKLSSIINSEDSPSISVRKLTRYLENYFDEEIYQYEHA